MYYERANEHYNYLTLGNYYQIAKLIHMKERVQECV